MPATYEPIATTTLSSSAANITFSSIPGTYTDLRLVAVLRGNGAFTVQNFRLRINGSTSSIYSYTGLYGNQTSAASEVQTNQPQFQPSSFYLPAANSGANIFGLVTIDFFSYAGSTNKTFLFTGQGDQKANVGGGLETVYRSAGLFQSTSAITSIEFTAMSGTSLASGSTATIYGILKA